MPAAAIVELVTLLFVPYLGLLIALMVEVGLLLPQVRRETQIPVSPLG